MADTGDTGQTADSHAPKADNGDSAPEHEHEDRATWSGRVTFWLAAVGSAVGLGNLWRFPYQCANWGAGAFIMAYFVALLTLGMPLLTQELALGQKHRSGDIEAFGRMNWRLRGIGLASVIGGFGIVTYYMMIIGLSMVYFCESFMVPLPFSGDVTDGFTYWQQVLRLTDDIESSGHDGGIFSWKVFGATTLCWVITFCCIRRGVKTASWAVKITMPLPFLLLFILLIKAATLPGAGDGIGKYLDFSDWSQLSDSPLWIAAIGQCFFSLSVCMGVMTAFGSYNPIDQDIATDEKVIAFMDVGASLVSGFVVYCILGYLTHVSGDNVEVTGGDPDYYYKQGGPGLVFGAFPVAIAKFKGANFFALIFYATLVLLGIDSAFSIVEAISTVIYDSDLNKYRMQWSRMRISTVLCVAGALGSFLYCFDTGFWWLDLVDFYINNYGMVFLGICETGACGWWYSYELIEGKIGTKSANIYRFGYWGSIVFASILSMVLATPETLYLTASPTSAPTGGFMTTDFFDGTATTGSTIVFTGGVSNSWIVGLLVGAAGWGVTCFLSWHHRSEESKELSTGELWWYIMGWENVEVLRGFMNSNGVGEENWNEKKHTLGGECYLALHHSTIGIYWGFLIKYWIPTILTVVLFSEFREKSYNPYSGYPWGYLTVGILWFATMVIIVVVVAVWPQWMTQKGDDGGDDEPDGADSKHEAVMTHSVEMQRDPAADDGAAQTED